MKKSIGFLSILLLFTTFINCSSDDGASSPLEALVGTWISTSIVFSDCLDSEENGILTCDPFCISVTINSDGTYSLTEVDDAGGQQSETGTVTATSTTILLCESTEPNCTDPDSYTLTNSVLIVTEAEDDISGCQSVITFNKQ
ncbi:hypothetical protein [Ekhidna sp.]|uniref:hypothetical protein n=1 Tax=Ekhidna sp. TaxID=2608089 RepID=UPI003299871E